MNGSRLRRDDGRRRQLSANSNARRRISTIDALVLKRSAALFRRQPRLPLQLKCLVHIARCGLLVAFSGKREGWTAEDGGGGVEESTSWFCCCASVPCRSVIARHLRALAFCRLTCAADMLLRTSRNKSFRTLESTGRRCC